MQAPYRSPSVVPPQRRAGLTIIELLVLLTLVAQMIGLLIPAVQKVRDSASRLQRNSNWGPFATTVVTYSDNVSLLGQDTLRGTRDALGDREIDPMVFGDLLDRYNAAIAQNELLQLQTQACIDTETNPIVDRQLETMKSDLDALLTALIASQSSVAELLPDMPN